MDEQSWSWLKGCGIGCGALVLIVAMASAVGLLRVLRPLQSAIDARAELEGRFGSEDSYTPSPDGTIAPDRIEAFLQVRNGLADTCERLTANTAAMARMEDLDQQENPSRAEVLRLAAAATKSAMRMGRLMGELFERRNQLLLAAGMGLGEYTHLYLVAYREQLTDGGPRTGILDGSPVNARIRSLIEAMLDRQLEAARGDGLPPAWIDSLAGERAAIASDQSRLPWQDGLPEQTRASLEPFQERIDSTFCSAATEVELLRNVRRTLAIQSE
jgi:hypothetical protein